MISLEPFLLGAALVTIASAAAIDAPRRNNTECYTIWEDGYRDYVPTYYETYIRESTSRLYMTSAPVVVVTSTGATSTVTATISTTVNTGDGTSTVPASVGFTPLASVVAAAGGAFIAAKHAVQAQVTAAPRKARVNALSRLMDCRYYEDCYPYEVNCVVHVRSVVTTTEIIEAGQPVTSTVVPASATATITVTTTNTLTGSVAPIATIFQVCQANNVIPYFSPTAAWADAQFNGNLGVSAGTDGTDCCQKCALMGASCQASAYTESVIGGSCAYFLSGGGNPTCIATTVAGIAEYQPGTNTNTYHFSNSNCGQLAVQALGSTLST
ncbi:hypothetical protein VMCG_10354 [Cytospora schulzeri]|uniref:Apple domain-containing protein n=1 Tax=Cytospora schulzeri TaxID=448051 RepID=A0A423VFM5_9PEZI|nr:hypothetical protein VMCG_10354 [Valsa malicola]